MAEDQTDDSQKTEEPTQKRIEESRKKGQVALSREINNWVILLAGTIVIAAMAPHFFSNLLEMMKAYVASADQIPTAPGGVSMALSHATRSVIFIIAFPLLVLMIAAFLSPFMQVGPLFAPEAVKPSIEKISLIKGFQRLFSMRSIMEFAKGILKITIIGVVGTIVMYPYFDKLEHLIDLPMLLVMDEMHGLIVRLMIAVLVVLLIIAVIDLIFQRSQHMKKMRMSRHEIREEFKQTEGDPHIRARLRQLRSEKARQRMMQNVPSADVVITNPTHFSIALKYDPETMEAPLCVAKGIDEVALRIREVAQEHDIILYENRPLARSLYEVVDIDETIPADMYQAVAEVISYVFKKRGTVH